MYSLARDVAPRVTPVQSEKRSPSLRSLGVVNSITSSPGAAPPFALPLIPCEAISSGPRYEDHLSSSALREKASNGRYRTGTVHVIDYPSTMGVLLDDSDEAVLLATMLDANRAVHRSIVVCEILESSETLLYPPGKRYGRVVHILMSRIPLLVGYCHPTINRFQCLDKRYPPLRADGDILTHCKDARNAPAFYKVQINQPWNASKFYPGCLLKEVLEPCDQESYQHHLSFISIETEKDKLLLQRSLIEDASSESIATLRIKNHPSRMFAVFPDGRSIRVLPESAGRSLDGDKVAVELIQGSASGEISARIISVVEKAPLPLRLTGTISNNFFNPHNKSYPSLVFSSSLKMSFPKDHFYLATMQEWTSKFPKCATLVSLGPMTDPEAQKVTLQMHFNTEEFDDHQKILEDDWTIPEEELRCRTDLRNKLSFTIDNEGSRDLDDALSCERLPNGNFEVWVHISDASYFVVAGSELDLLARYRGSSIYLEKGNDLPMLPFNLSERLCSLLADEDRLAISVRWELNPNGKQISVQVVRSVIRSRLQLSYDIAEQILSEPAVVSEPLSLALHNLLLIIPALRDRREAKMDQKTLGSSTERVEEHPMTKMLVSEMMVQANKAVAKWMISRCKEGILLQGFALKPAVGDTIEEDGEQAYQFSKRGGPLVTQAGHSIKEYRHPRLGVSCYSRFTSPIRRYTDLLTHRIVVALLSNESLPYSPEELREILSEIPFKRCTLMQEVADLMRAYRKAESFPERQAATVVSLTNIGILLQLPNHEKPHFIKYKQANGLNFTPQKDMSSLLLSWTSEFGHVCRTKLQAGSSVDVEFVPFLYAYCGWPSTQPRLCPNEE